MYKEETWERINAANAAAGWPTDFSVAERDQIDALARELDRQLQRYPVIHAWPTNNGSQLTFWCQWCKTHHVHGRHSGTSYLDAVARANAKENWTPRFGAILPLRVWKRYLQRFASCRYNPNKPGGRGFCTCPVGSGNGHRVAHCWRTDSAYYDHGYILHEVEPNDARALRKPTRKRQR